mgnify:CR=1 FL=1
MGNKEFNVLAGTFNDRILANDEHFVEKDGGILEINPRAFSRPNLAINSNFDFWQEGTSLSGVSGWQRTNDGGADRSSGSTFSTSRQAFEVGQTSVPNGPKYYKRIVVSSVAGAGNRCISAFDSECLEQTAGKQVTFSIWLKADAAKNISCEFTQGFGTGGSSGVNSIGVKKQQIGTTWALYSFTATMPSISGKTIGTTPGSVRVVLWFDAGSDYNSRTDSLGQQSGTFDMAQYKFEIGPTATDWEPYNLADELVKCQRYCEKSYDVDVAPGTISHLGRFHRLAFNAMHFYDNSVHFRQDKAYPPTITFYSPNTGAVNNIRDASVGADLAVTNNGIHIGTTGFTATQGGLTSDNEYIWHFIARAYLQY